MRFMHKFLLIFAVFLAVPATSMVALATEQPTRNEAMTGCDALAADPDDTRLAAEVPRVADGIIDLKEAARLCEAAVKLAPEEPRFAHQAGRVALLKRDYGIAKAYFSTAAEKGYAAAKHGLARILLTADAYDGPVPATVNDYLAGPSGALPYADAIRFLHEAEAGGHPAAAIDLGQLLLSGALVLRDAEAARVQFKLASDKGVLAGDVALGEFFQNGPSIQRDYGLAREAFDRAAAKGAPVAKQALAILAEQGLGEPLDLAKARKLKGEAAGLGYVAPELPPGKDLLRLAIAGDGPAAYQLGAVEEAAGNLESAERLYRIAGSRGFARGFVAEGKLLKKRDGDPEVLFRLAAERGSNDGAQALGDHLVQIGRTQEAEGWVQLAAMANMPGARKALATHYAKGTLNRKSPKNAREWYQKAIEGGDPTARLGLAEMMLAEAAEKGDYAEARRLFEQMLKDPAVTNSDRSEAAYQIGLMAMNGLGQAPDARLARDMLIIAGDLGDVRAMVLLGGLYRGDQLGASNLVEARRWYEKAAEQAELSAMMALASIAAEGSPDPKAEEEAFRWLERAAHFGSVDAKMASALAHRFGIGTPKDDAKAFELIRSLSESAGEDNFWPRLNLARAYELGIGVPVDLAAAHEIYVGLADGENAPLPNLGLARIYAKGLGGEPDPAQAYVYAQRASAMGDDEATVMIANLLLSGEGVPKDEPAAIEILTTAAGFSQPKSSLALAKLLCRDGKDSAACVESAKRIHGLVEIGIAGSGTVFLEAMRAGITSATPDYAKEIETRESLAFRRNVLTNGISVIE